MKTRMANSVDPDETVSSGGTLFVKKKKKKKKKKRKILSRSRARVERGNLHCSILLPHIERYSIFK